jgi:hypothetical protein
MLISEQNVERSVARDDDSSNGDDSIKNLSALRIFELRKNN